MMKRKVTDFRNKLPVSYQETQAGNMPFTSIYILLSFKEYEFVALLPLLSTALSLKIQTCCHVTVCRFVNICRLLEAAFCLRL